MNGCYSMGVVNLEKNGLVGIQMLEILFFRRVYRWTHEMRVNERKFILNWGHIYLERPYKEKPISGRAIGKSRGCWGKDHRRKAHHRTIVRKPRKRAG